MWCQALVSLNGVIAQMMWGGALGSFLRQEDFKLGQVAHGLAPESAAASPALGAVAQAP
jgi:hypothetical protein